MKKKQKEQLKSIKYTLIILSFPVLLIFLPRILVLLAKNEVSEYIDTGELFTSYVLSLLNHLLHNPIIIGITVAVIVASITISVLKIKKAKVKKSEIIKQFAKLTFLTIAFITVFAISITISHSSLSIQTESDIYEIANEINNKPKEDIAIVEIEKVNNYLEETESPQFKFNDYELNQKIIIENIKIGHYSDFYKTFVEKNKESYEFPQLIISNEKSLIYDEILYINDFAQEYSSLYQQIGKYFVQDYLRDKNTDFPEIFVLTRDEYIKRREGEIDALIAEYDEYIQTLKENIELAKGWITQDEKYAQMYGGQWWMWLEQDKEWLAYYENSLMEWEDWRTRIVERKIDALTELGRFNPPSEIDIVLAEYEYYPADQYLGTLVHEYFHYISDEEDIWLHDFWEESITEYFTQKVTIEKLGYNNHFSYSNIVPIMEEIIKDVGEEKILNIYFSKNQEEATLLLNETYGETFWQDYESKLYHATYMYDEESEKIVEEVMEIIR